MLNGTTFTDETPGEVARCLDYALRSGDRVRLFYGDKATGKPWLDDSMVTGFVKRSSGQCKVPILMATRYSSFGPPILDSCIVAIQQGKYGTMVYRHPGFRFPTLEIRDINEEWCGQYYRAGVYDCDNTNVANFKTTKQAERWVDFMCGRRMTR